MAVKNRKGRTIYLGLDYSEFTGGVTEVNRKIGLLDAEMKLASAQVENYGNEMDAAGLKHDYLTQKIALQKQKVEEARKAYDAAMNSQKASQKVIDNLDKHLLLERTELEKLEKQLKDTDGAAQGLNESGESFGDVIRSLASELGLSGIPAIEKLASRFDMVDKEVGKAVLGIGAVISKFVSCTIEAAAVADELNTLSATTNISTRELQKLQYAADFVDVSVDTMTSSISQLTNNMRSARSGSSDLQSVFNRLHIKIKDSSGELRSANDVFYEAIDALGRIKNETERDAMAMQLFGESARNLNPLIEAGSSRLKELGVEAENMGMVMSEKDLTALNQLQDAFDKFDNTSQSLKNSLGLVLLPILTGLFNAIAAIPAPVLKTIVVLASVVATIVMVVKAIKSVTDTGKGIKSFLSGTNISTIKTTAIVMGVVVALIALAAIIAVIIGKKDDLKETMESVGDSVQNLQGTVSNTQMNVARVSSNAAGTKRFVGGITWVGEAGPELVRLPGGSRIYSNEESGKILGGDTYYVNLTVPASEIDDFQKIIRIVKDQRSARRRGVINS